VNNLDIEKFIKIKCIEENIKISQLASKLNSILKIPENTLKNLKVIT